MTNISNFKSFELLNRSEQRSIKGGLDKARCAKLRKLKNDPNFPCIHGNG